MHGGSRETRRLYSSFAKLFKVVNGANTFFFAGNLERASGIIADALELFKKLSDEKAVAVASNNMGNILGAIFLKIHSL
jgi:hypothetical protein